MSRIYWDTMLFIYWLENHPQHAAAVERIHTRMTERGDRLCTSVFTMSELLTGPYRLGATEESRRLREYLESPAVELLPFSLEAAERYAWIRGQHRVPAADAIHLACAVTGNIDLFLTMDDALRKVVIPGVPWIAGLDGGVVA